MLSRGFGYCVPLLHSRKVLKREEDRGVKVYEERRVFEVVWSTLE